MGELSFKDVFVKPGRGEISLARWIVGMTDRFQKLAESLGVRADDCREICSENGCKVFSTGLVYSKNLLSYGTDGPVLVWGLPISLNGGLDNNHIELGFGFVPFREMVEESEPDGFGRRPPRFTLPWQAGVEPRRESVRVQFWPEGSGEGDYASLDWDYTPGSGLCEFVRSCSDILGSEDLKLTRSYEVDGQVMETEQGWELAKRLVRLYVGSADGPSAVPAGSRRPARRKKR